MVSSRGGGGGHGGISGNSARQRQSHGHAKTLEPNPRVAAARASLSTTRGAIVAALQVGHRRC